MPARSQASSRSQQEAEQAPIYKRIQAYVLENIVSDRWRSGEKIDSEAQLCARFAVSRMTVNKALRELVNEGHVHRIAGVGTFVAAPDGELSRTGLITLKSIANQIEASGHNHLAQVFVLRSEPANQSVAYAMGIPVAQNIFHSIIMHMENEVPIQFEERFVLPEVAPNYLDNDYTRMTTFDYLHSVAKVTEAENVITAVRPEKEVCQMLRIPADEPCLSIRRRTWWDDRVTTYSSLVHPGDRFEVSGRFPILLSIRS